MKSIKIAPVVQRALESVLRSYPVVVQVVQHIDRSGGRAFLVGGAVRDLLLERTVKDLDIEVHALSLQELQKILKGFGPVSEVGKAFVNLKEGQNVSDSELRQYLLENLAKYKVPKYIVLKEELPLSAAGKILKRELK